MSDHLYICIDCLYNRKAENHFLNVVKILTSIQLRGMDPGVMSHGIKADPLGYLCSEYDCFLMRGYWDMSFWKKLAYKTSPQCDADANTNANADYRGDYNSSRCTSYRRATSKNMHQNLTIG